MIGEIDEKYKLGLNINSGELDNKQMLNFLSYVSYHPSHLSFSTLEMLDLVLKSVLGFEEENIGHWTWAKEAVIQVQ